MTSLYLDKEQKVKVSFEDPPEEETVTALKQAYRNAQKKSSSQAPEKHERIHTR